MRGTCSQRQMDELICIILRPKKTEETSKEKHSLTRKLVGYRNWRQRWCKKEGNKILGKEK